MFALGKYHDKMLDASMQRKQFNMTEESEANTSKRVKTDDGNMLCSTTTHFVNWGYISLGCPAPPELSPTLQSRAMPSKNHTRCLGMPVNIEKPVPAMHTNFCATGVSGLCRHPEAPGDMGFGTENCVQSAVYSAWPYMSFLDPNRFLISRSML
ncbi:unnamed protein product [Tuber aestivum]|uniref:Uncharacterized protein n=1 Tax=Tuber aestivum TaxID=59557 RepID=A0A292Q9C0_9PEZI|nr:unnamed protein product [Tuber aestivum]